MSKVQGSKVNRDRGSCSIESNAVLDPREPRSITRSIMSRGGSRDGSKSVR